MPFGPEMRIQIPAGEVILGSIDEAELETLPPIDDVPEVTRFVTEHFMEEARTFRTPKKEYFHELKDAPVRKDDGGTNWFMRFRHEVEGEMIEEIAGFTGYRNKRTDESDVTSADTRIVVMQPHLLGLGGDGELGVGGAAAMARTIFALEHDNVDILRANVDLNNKASYKTVRRMGYTCVWHFQAYPDPARHKVELHNPHSRLALPESTLPYWEDDMSHGEHDLSWAAPRMRAVRALEFARDHVRFTA